MKPGSNLEINKLTIAATLGSAPEQKSFHQLSRSVVPEQRLLVEKTPTISK